MGLLEEGAFLLDNGLKYPLSRPFWLSEDGQGWR